MDKRFPMAVPFGWFFVSYADEVKPKEIKTLRYFGLEMVLFRSAGGELGLLDAHCLHMGAHLGKGGKVEGETIRCPFHHWSFDTKGRCQDIPYADTMPPRLKDGRICQKTYPVVERNQVIWAWYHPEGLAPTFDVDEHKEIGSSEWTPLEKYQWEFASNPQEIAENGVDVAHFRFVHKMDAVPEGHTTYDGIVRKSTAKGRKTITHADGRTEVKESMVETIQKGAGQKYTRIHGITDTMVMVLATPVTEDKVELRMAFTFKKAAEDSLEFKAARHTIKSLTGQQGVEGDIPIWNHKTFHQYPLLCDGDGPVMQFRKYFKQFYAENHKGG